MNQIEMSKYLKLITCGITILFLALILLFLPDVLKDEIRNSSGENVYWCICIFIWLSSIPCLLSLWKFWGICTLIGKDLSFSKENAKALRQMSHYMLTDTAIYIFFLAITCILGWYKDIEWLLFGIIFVLFICISLTVLCAALSHLVYKASQIQDEQNLTI